MTRQTSIEVYHQIEEEGLLSKLRLKVFKIIVFHGPLTAQEMIRKAREVYGDGLVRDCLHQRLSELKIRGVIKETRRRVCTVTGREVYEWQDTAKLPIEPQKEKDPTFSELIKALCGALDEMNKHLDEQGNKVPEHWRNWNETSKKIVKHCSKYRKKK